jgi:nucleotidyltransferase/DNA polymerase involved in DNA repair
VPGRACKARPWHAVVPIADALLERRSLPGRETHRRFNTVVKFAPHGALVADNLAQRTCGDSPEHRLEILVHSGASIGKEIKTRFREEIGEWMKCSIGVSTNRFLAKLAAFLHKPDGFDIIEHTNVLEVYNPPSPPVISPSRS